MSNILHRIINTSTTEVATITNITFSDQAGIQHHADLSAIGLSSDFTGQYAAVSYSKTFVSGSPISRNYLSDTDDIVKTIASYDTTTLVVNNTTNLVAGWEGSGVYSGRYIVSITSATWLLMSNTPSAPPTPGASITFSTSTREITLSGTSPTTGIGPGWYINSNGYGSSGTVVSIKSASTLVVDFLPTSPTVGNPLIFSTSTKLNYVELDNVSSLVNGLYAYGNGFNGQQVTNISGNIITLSAPPSTYPVIGQSIGFGTGNIYTIPVNSEVSFNLDFTTSTVATGTYTSIVSVDIWQGSSNTTYYYNEYVVLSRLNSPLPNPTPGNINPSGYYSSFINNPGYSPGYSVPFTGFNIPESGRVVTSVAYVQAALLLFNDIDTFSDVASVSDAINQSSPYSPSSGLTYAQLVAANDPTGQSSALTYPYQSYTYAQALAANDGTAAASMNAPYQNYTYAMALSQNNPAALAHEYSQYRPGTPYASPYSIQYSNNNTDPAQAAQQASALKVLSEKTGVLAALSGSSFFGIKEILERNAKNGRTPENDYTLAALQGIQKVVQTISEGVNWLRSNLSLDSVSKLRLSEIGTSINNFVLNNQYVSVAISSVKTFIVDIGNSLQNLVPNVNLAYLGIGDSGNRGDRYGFEQATTIWGDPLVKSGLAIASAILSPSLAIASTLATLAGFTTGPSGEVGASLVRSVLQNDVISSSLNSIGTLFGGITDTFKGFGQYIVESVDKLFGTNLNGINANSLSSINANSLSSINTNFFSSIFTSNTNGFSLNTVWSTVSSFGTDVLKSVTQFADKLVGTNQSLNAEISALNAKTSDSLLGTIYGNVPITSSIETQSSDASSVSLSYEKFAPTDTNYGAFGETILSGGGDANGSVNVNAYMPNTSKLAGQMIHGDALVLLSEDRQGTIPGVVISNTISEQRLLTMVSESGIKLTCSDNTPLTLEDGSSINSTEVLGKKLPVEDQNGFRWELIVEVLDAGHGKVATIYCEDQCYAAGDEPGRWIWTHNASNIKYGDFAANFDGPDIYSLNLGNN